MLRFDYHRSVAPMMWVFVALASIELLVVHFLLALWWPLVAAVVSTLTLASIVWLVRAIRAFRTMPVVLTDDHLILRVGRFREHRLPLENIRGLRQTFSGEDVNAKGVSNLALIAYPNVIVDLKQPLPRRRGATRAIAHRLDAPHDFIGALEKRLNRA